MIPMEQGALTLFLEPSLETGNVYYVVGEGFENYVTGSRNFDELRQLLQKCIHMQDAYQSDKDYKFTHIRELIQAYNKYCK